MDGASGELKVGIRRAAIVTGAVGRLVAGKWRTVRPEDAGPVVCSGIHYHVTVELEEGAQAQHDRAMPFGFIIILGARCQGKGWHDDQNGHRQKRPARPSRLPAYCLGSSYSNSLH